jgi:putative addiction module CopG family antidote
MKTSLSPGVQRLLDEKVGSGRYRSADEVVRKGLALIEREEASRVPASSAPGNLAEIFSAIAGDVPETEWQKVPADLARNLDCYCR